ncbi:hypothetical protein AC1031_012172 [Aphanomyces cochlioides]|nr:hypothetical protein AC1031_012172 [Aphanomyces cochlioides]
MSRGFALVWLLVLAVAVATATNTTGNIDVPEIKAPPARHGGSVAANLLIYGLIAGVVGALVILAMFVRRARKTKEHEDRAKEFHGQMQLQSQTGNDIHIL